MCACVCVCVSVGHLVLEDDVAQVKHGRGDAVPEGGLCVYVCVCVRVCVV